MLNIHYVTVVSIPSVLFSILWMNWRGWWSVCGSSVLSWITWRSTSLMTRLQCTARSLTMTGTGFCKRRWETRTQERSIWLHKLYSTAPFQTLKSSVHSCDIPEHKHYNNTFPSASLIYLLGAICSYLTCLFFCIIAFPFVKQYFNSTVYELCSVKLWRWYSGLPNSSS